MTDEPRTRRPRPPASGRIVAGALPTALLLTLAAAAALFAVLGSSVIGFPYPIDYGEGPLLDQAVRLAQRQNIYDADLSTPPYTIANYPPLYLLLQAPWVHRYGPALWYGRLLSYVCVFASALLLVALLRALRTGWTPALVGGTLLLSIPYVSYWGALFRIDALALALSLGALLVVVRRPAHRGSLCLTALLLTAAIYTRQSYGLAAPAAALCWLATREAGRRRAVTLALLVAGLSGSILLVLHVLTDGGFLFHTITANLNEFHLARLGHYAKELVRLLPGLLVVGVVFSIAGPRLSGDAWRLVTPYLIAAALAAATIGKSGSNVNYLLELSAALCLAAGALLATLWHRVGWRNAVALVLLVQVSVLLGGTRYRQHVRWKLEQRPALDRLMELIHRAEGRVLADEELGLLPLDGRPVHVQPFELTQLARRGAWDPTPFLDELDNREFDTVLIYKVPWSPIHLTRWTPEMLERVERGYAPVGAIGHTVIYRPKEL